MSLTGRGAVVTGAGRGIGAACARALARAGARVVVSSRTGPEIERVATDITAAGGVAAAHVADVSDPDAVDRLADAARDLLGRVDIVVNSAGIATSAPVSRLSLEEWDRTLRINATGTFLCTRAFLSGMLEFGWGRVVNVASVAGLAGGPYIAAYAASKHAVIGFTRSLAAEVATQGVTVNAVCPGYVDSDMTRASVERIVDKTGRTPAEALAALASANAHGRLIRPDEVAHAVITLCAEEAASINGHALTIDGGASW